MNDDNAEASVPGAEENTLDGGVFYRHWHRESPRAVVLLVHGLGEHSGRYQHVADALRAVDMAVLAPDHVGHGRSPGERVFVRRFSEYLEPLDALTDLMDRTYPGVPKIIVGHSMGGLIAGCYLLERQDRFAAAAFSGAAFEIPEPPGALSMLTYRILAALMPTMGALALDAGDISRDPQVVSSYRDDPLVHDGKVTVGLMVALLSSMQELQRRRREITLPVLVMHGAGDVMTPPGGSRHFHDGVGSVDKALKIYPDLYHEIFNEPERELVIGDLTDWLKARIAAQSSG